MARRIETGGIDIEAIKDQYPLAETVSQHVALKRRGHQLIGLSQGMKTVKMFNGHRGINHPVKNLITGKSEITSQNHGFVISRESIAVAENAEITHVHLNDDTVAGIKLKARPVFSVQYHPEASAGPHDSRYLFDQFIANIASGKKIAAVH